MLPVEGKREWTLLYASATASHPQCSRKHPLVSGSHFAKFLPRFRKLGCDCDDVVALGERRMEAS